MDKYLCLTPVEPHRRRSRTRRRRGACRHAARQEADAVELESIERIFDFAQAAFHVRQRYRREHAKAARIIADHLSAVLVTDAGTLARRVATVVEPDAGAGHRHQRRCDARFLHLVKRELRGSARIGRCRQDICIADQAFEIRTDISGGIDVMMGIDDVRGPLDCARARPPNAVAAAAAGSIAKTSRRDLPSQRQIIIFLPF